MTNPCVGGIAGENSGLIEDCSVSGNVNAGTSGTATPYAGGIVGKNSGDVSRCYATGSVNSYLAETSMASVGGGIAGRNESVGSISNCAALNSKVYNNNNSTTSFQGRIVGQIDGFGTFDDNYAYKNMQLGGNSAAVLGGTVANQDGADIDDVLMTDDDSSYWTAMFADWTFEAGPSEIEPLGSPWYWSKTIAIPGNTVNMAGVPEAYVPALWFE
jgi:hypothetical protein